MILDFIGFCKKATMFKLSVFICALLYFIPCNVFSSNTTAIQLSLKNQNTHFTDTVRLFQKDKDQWYMERNIDQKILKKQRIKVSEVSYLQWAVEKFIILHPSEKIFPECLETYEIIYTKKGISHHQSGCAYQNEDFARLFFNFLRPTSK